MVVAPAPHVVQIELFLRFAFQPHPAYYDLRHLQQQQKVAAYENQNELFDKMSKEITKLKDTNTSKNTQKADKIQNNTNCNNNNNNKIQNIHNDIKIIAYGKEDLSHILDKDYKTILNKGFKSVPALMESIHFNLNKPENHNIYISNMRDNHVLIYDGNEWQLRERDNACKI